jgi:hypothetical protein
MHPTGKMMVVLLALLLAVAVGFVPAALGGQLLGSDVASQMLIQIDGDTAVWWPIGNTGVCTMSGLAYDSNHDVLYGVSPSTDNLYVIDRSTGQATMVGPPGALGYGNTNGLAYDPVHDILYATDNNTNGLLTVDPVSGIGTWIAAVSGGFTEIEGLGFDPEAEVLYGLTQLQRRIVAIDVQTAAATAVSANLPNLVWRGLDYDAEYELLFATAVDLYGDAPLYSFDPQSAALAFIGDLVGVPAVQGLAYVSDPVSALPRAKEPGYRPLTGPALCLSYPNPVVEHTGIRFHLYQKEEVTLLILDAAGRRVRQLLSAAPCEAGIHRIGFNGLDDGGRRLKSGVYLCVMTAGRQRLIQRLHLFR